MSAAAGAPTDLEAAYADSRDSLVQYLTRRLRCRHTAEDLAQDVFLALPRTDAFVSFPNPRALLFRIAGNLAANRARQEARRHQLREVNAPILWTAVDEVTPERQLLGAEALDCLAVAIDLLPDRTRRILAWRRVDGLKNREIAARLGISETAVEKHMRSAMAALARALPEDDLPPA